MNVAYADESMRTVDGESMYLLGATVFDEDVPQLDHLVSLRPKGSPKLHWRELGRFAQVKVMDALADIPSMTTVAIGVPMNPHKQERARRKCLEAMIEILVEDGTNKLVLESRGPALDLRDIRLVDSIRSRIRGIGLIVCHAKGVDEPRLWVPDQVLGAYGDQLCLREFDDSWNNAWYNLERRTRLEVINL